jgi:hypothetical protein
MRARVALGTVGTWKQREAADWIVANDVGVARVGETCGEHVAGKRRNGMTALIGWGAFRASRKSPGPIFPRQHANWVHGRYAHSRIRAMRQVRAYIKVTRGAWWLSVLDNDPPKPLGWMGYRLKRPKPRDAFVS